MKILVMGAGGQGAPCASILSKDPDISKVKLCDLDPELLEKVAAKIGSSKVITEQVDATDIDAIVKAAEGMDAIIDLLTPALFLNVLAAAKKAKVHYVNTAWEEYLFEGFEENGIQLGAKLQGNDDYANAGLTAILGCGMTSGFTTNVLIRHYVDKLDTIESIKIRLAKKDTTISEEEEILKPWNPGWNPRQAVLDFVVPTYKYVDGEFIKMEQVFAEPEIWDFPGIGKTLVAHHAHEEPFSLPHTFAEKGLKYCDFKYYVGKQIAPIIALGLGQEEKINVKGTEISPLDVVLHFVPSPGDAFLNEDPTQFSHLDQTKLVVIISEMIGTKNGKKLKYLINVPAINVPRQQMYDTYGTSIISVALPAVIGAKMAIEGTMKGIIQPQDLDAGRFLDLMKKSGHPTKWNETVTEL